MLKRLCCNTFSFKIDTALTHGNTAADYRLPDFRTQPKRFQGGNVGAVFGRPGNAYSLRASMKRAREAVALWSGTGSSCLAAPVNEFWRLHMVRGANSSCGGWK